MKLSLGVAALALALISGCVSVKDSGGGSRFYQSKSPTQMGAAIFTKNVGFQDTAVTFEVIDPKKGAAPIEVGLVGDAGWQGFMPKNAIWSRDGSVVAVQGADFKTWSHAYDFKRHSSSLNEVYPLDKRAAAIEKLLRNRGGIGAKVLDDWADFDDVARPVESNRR